MDPAGRGQVVTAKKNPAAGKRPRRSRETPSRVSRTRDVADLLFEIGVEELPGGYVPPALEQLEHAARDAFAGARLALGDLCAYGTPRRLALFVRDLAERQADFDEEAMGFPLLKDEAERAKWLPAKDGDEAPAKAPKTAKAEPPAKPAAARAS